MFGSVIRQGRKEIFYLTTLNTFYLRLHGIEHVVKDHYFQLATKDLLLCTIPHIG